MITENEFERLISKNESSILDFKGELYDFKNDKNNNVTAKFIKDVISFSNTIRTETSFIIFGIQELDNGEVEFRGINGKTDDSIFQDKVKDKVIPRPIFSFYTIKYKEKLYGILEFPIEKYEMPIVATINNLRGLEAGKVYYRNGTSNTEATAYDVIRINDWLKSLPEKKELNSLNEKISQFIKELTKAELKLSVIISDLLNFSKQYGYEELMKFCQDQIGGIKSNDGSDYRYREQKVVVSWNEININPYSYIKPTAELVRSEMLSQEGFFEGKILLHHPIIEIESAFERFKNEPNSYGIMKTDSKTLLGMQKKHILFLYVFPDNYYSLYRNIRQKAIDLLMKL